MQYIPLRTVYCLWGWVQWPPINIIHAQTLFLFVKQIGDQMHYLTFQEVIMLFRPYLRDTENNIISERVFPQVTLSKSLKINLSVLFIVKSGRNVP